MVSQKKPKRTFNGMGYSQVQRTNSANRRQLQPSDQQLLKNQGYRNVGWDQVIALYQKLEELTADPFSEMSLEELFLAADRIGNKYQTPEEIQSVNQQLAQAAERISVLVDQRFPDTEIEAIDFSSHKPQKSRKSQNQKIYRTIKV